MKHFTIVSGRECFMCESMKLVYVLYGLSQIVYNYLSMYVKNVVITVIKIKCIKM